MRVDVGIPTHRRADYVREAVDSVMAQTHTDWRLIVSDDASVDETTRRALARHLQDDRIVLESQSTRLGLALNKTFLATHGTAPLVAILDDDDRWEPEFLARRVEFMRDHPEASLVFGGNIEIDEGGSAVRDMPFHVGPGLNDQGVFLRLLLRHNVVSTPSVLFRRGSFEAAGPWFDPRFGQACDWDLWIRLVLEGPAGFLAVRDSAYRRHAGQMSPDRASDELLALLDQNAERIRDRFPEAMPSPREFARQRTGLQLSVGLDALGRGRLKEGRTHARAALASNPRALLDPRTPLLLAGLISGGRLSRCIQRARRLVRRLELDVHRRRT